MAFAVSSTTRYFSSYIRNIEPNCIYVSPYGHQLYMLTYQVIAKAICAATGVNIGGKACKGESPTLQEVQFLALYHLPKKKICQPCSTKELLAAWLPLDACCTTFQSQLRKEQ